MSAGGGTMGWEEPCTSFVRKMSADLKTNCPRRGREEGCRQSTNTDPGLRK